MPAMSPKLEFRFLQGRVEAAPQTLVGAIRIRVPPRWSGTLRAKGSAPPTIATEVRVALRLAADLEKPNFLGYAPTQQSDGSFTLELPDLAPGDDHWILVEIPFDHPAELGLSRRRIAEVELGWAQTAPRKGKRRTKLNAEVELVNQVLVDSPDPEILQYYQRLGGSLADS